MGIQENPYPLRIDKGLMAKLKIIARDNGRSVNKEIEFVVREHIKAYETANGPVAVPEEPMQKAAP